MEGQVPVFISPRKNVAPELFLSFIMCMCRYRVFISCIVSNIGLHTSIYIHHLCVIRFTHFIYMVFL
jgi:hypothetical protein